MFDSDLSSGFVDGAGGCNIAYTWSGIELLHPSTNGYSEVYRAKRYGRWYVLKRLLPQAAADARYTTLLEKEFAISCSLEHPNIVKTIGFEEVENLGACIIQEYVDGTTWKEFFSSPAAKALTHQQLVDLITELCNAVDYLHQRQIIHRDLKLDNIIITNGHPHVRLIDFGLADASVFDILKEPAGTDGYIAPEVPHGGVATFKSDIYSLGIVLSEMPVQWRRLRHCVSRCLQQDPAKRPSAADVAKALKSRKLMFARRLLVALSLLVVVAIICCLYAMFGVHK